MQSSNGRCRPGDRDRLRRIRLPSVHAPVRVRSGGLHGRTGLHARLGRALSGAVELRDDPLPSPRSQMVRAARGGADRGRDRCQDLPAVHSASVRRPRDPRRLRPPRRTVARGDVRLQGHEPRDPDPQRVLRRRSAGSRSTIPASRFSSITERTPLRTERSSRSPNRWWARVRACSFSTSVLGGPMMDWADEWRYPFPRYLAALARYAELPSGQLRLGDRLAVVRGRTGQVPAAAPDDRRSRLVSVGGGQAPLPRWQREAALGLS